MAKLNIAYFGAPDFASGVLKRIVEDTDLPVTVRFVATQPDRKAGRKQILTSTPVKQRALQMKIPVIDNLEFNTLHSKLKEVDLVLLYAFGSLLPANILKMPKWGFWNIHPSLLPQYRGTSPITYSLLMGEKTTGVSLMEMDERMDHGSILNQKTYEIQEEDTRENLEKRLSDIGYELFKQSVQLLIDGTLQKVEQNHEKRTFTRLLTKQDGFIPFPIVQKILKGEPLIKDDVPAIISNYFLKYGTPPAYNFQLSAFNLFRGLSPWPGLWTVIPGKKRLKITRMQCIKGMPVITHVQLEGKKEVDITTFQTAYNVS
ncbi:MAG: methionyl-tRNA formyltransferase [bacterium]